VLYHLARLTMVWHFLLQIAFSDSTSTPIVPIFFWVLYCEAPLTTMIQNMLWSTALCQLHTQRARNQLLDPQQPVALKDLTQFLSTI